MIITITKPEPTFTIKLEDGRGNLRLTREEFIKLHDEMTGIYNDNYQLITQDDDF